MHDQGITVTPRDVYNIRELGRRRILAGRSPIAALLDGFEVTAFNAPYYTKFDNLRRRTHLFIVSPSAKKICSTFSVCKVWLIDSTYKTNRFGLPLMNVVGVTATSQSFTFAYCYMASEKEENYLKAVRLMVCVFGPFSVVPGTFVTDRELGLMNALDSVFLTSNRLLYRWHLSKNITTKLRRTFESIDTFTELVRQWNALVFASTVSSFDQQHAAMRQSIPTHNMTNLDNTWPIYKDRFVAASMRSKLHFGHTTTSRVESAHSVFKKWISVSTGDFFTVNGACRLACHGQLAAIKLKTAQKRAIADLQFGAMFSAVMGKVSIAGLRSALWQNHMRHKAGEECLGMFISSFGHPSKHTFRARSAAATAPTVAGVVPLSFSEFDNHWWLVQPSHATVVTGSPPSTEDTFIRLREEFDEAPIYRRRVILDHLGELLAAEVQNPPMIRSFGRPVGSSGASQSTQRNPLEFELGEASLRPRRKCRQCKQPCRDIRTCRQPPLNASMPPSMSVSTPPAVNLDALGLGADWEHFTWPPEITAQLLEELEALTEVNHG